MVVNKKVVLGAMAMAMAVPAVVIPMGEDVKVKADSDITIEDRQLLAYETVDVNEEGIKFNAESIEERMFLTEDGRIFDWVTNNNILIPMENLNVPGNIKQFSYQGREIISVTEEGKVYRDKEIVKGLPKIKRVFAVKYTGRIGDDIESAFYATAENGDVYYVGYTGDIRKVEGIKNVIDVTSAGNKIKAKAYYLTEDGSVYRSEEFKDGDYNEPPHKENVEGVTSIYYSNNTTGFYVKGGKLHYFGKNNGSSRPETTIDKAHVYEGIEDISKIVKSGVRSGIIVRVLTTKGDLYSLPTTKNEYENPIKTVSVQGAIDWGGKHLVDSDGNISYYGSNMDRDLGNGTTALSYTSSTYKVYEPTQLTMVSQSKTVEVKYKELSNRDVQISWTPVKGAKFQVKKNGVVIHDDVTNTFVDSDVITGGEYEYEIIITPSDRADVTSKKMKYVHGEEPDFSKPTEPEQPSEPSDNPDWSFGNPDVPFTGVKPSVSVMGGKKTSDIKISNANWVEEETTVTTEQGDIVLKPDGNGNTLVSMPDGLGDKNTDEVVAVEYKGVNFMDIKIKPTPKLDFNFGI